MLYIVLCLCAAVCRVSTVGLKERVSLLEIQVSRDSYRTKTDIMELTHSVESLNSSVEMCLDLKDKAAVISETDEYRNDKVYQNEVNEAARFHVLSYAIGEEKRAMRRKVDELHKEVKQNMKDTILQMERKFIKIDKKGTDLKEIVESNSQIISTIGQNMTDISQIVFSVVGLFKETSKNISRLEKELAEIKSQTEKAFKDWVAFKDDITLNIQSIRKSLAPQCPSYWTENEGTCYFLVSLNLNWSSSVQHCRELGGKLAEPNTEKKMNFILETYPEDGFPWLGASVIDTEGLFVWNSSKKPVEYLPWKPGQPNNYGGDQNCIQIWEAELNDLACKELKPSICEKPLED